ncbi:DUF4249 domain-containing protein [Mucilaginibacter gotjawali]|uniref:DUF4249 domain-containing protein n=1 Tax=Mucilaginibacter gotjawali TaxID=1550579 RepID=A0A839SIE6_9SPHI|nr:DUF4249 domain-containing protein [Mucilaginibacter gotjawali]MBB3057162.1 hypothetical protein [Mucilaginibacter gotjawali]
MVISVSCKKLYNPPAISAPGSYLVVEGVINNGPDSTIFKLSHTVNLASKITLNPLTGAVLTIESDQNTIYPLTETRKGSYGIGSLQLDNNRKYRLRIKTADNEYLSDFVPVVNAPPVDTISFNVENKGIQINAGTHDAVNNTRYYRWDYQETWVFHSYYQSGYVSNGDTVVERVFPANEVYNCWGNDTSSTIILGSSAKLSQNVITNNPLTFVSSTSEKLGTKYSIMVREYALTADAYKFWQILKTNTEQLGSIFDAQPSQINGNIHSTKNPSEAVIGYVSAGTVTSKRIFITDQQLPGWVPAQPYPNCTLDSIYLQYKPAGATVAVNQENVYFNYNHLANPQDALIPVAAIIVIPPIGPEMIIGHTGAQPECVDCTLRGTNKQPDFWR